MSHTLSNVQAYIHLTPAVKGFPSQDLIIPCSGKNREIQHNLLKPSEATSGKHQNESCAVVEITEGMQEKLVNMNSFDASQCVVDITSVLWLPTISEQFLRV